jgi:Flp pilus assembly protein TadG
MNCLTFFSCIFTRRRALFSSASAGRINPGEGDQPMRDCRGSVSIEFAVLFLFLLIPALSIFDVYVVALSKMQLEFATEAAARCFATGNINCTTSAATAVYAAALMPNTSPSNFTVSTMACGGSVIANYNYTPMFLPSVISIDASACYPT